MTMTKNRIATKESTLCDKEKTSNMEKRHLTISIHKNYFKVFTIVLLIALMMSLHFSLAYADDEISKNIESMIQEASEIDAADEITYDDSSDLQDTEPLPADCNDEDDVETASDPEEQLNPVEETDYAIEDYSFESVKQTHGKTAKIAFFGDSITVGRDGSRRGLYADVPFPMYIDTYWNAECYNFGKSGLGWMRQQEGNKIFYDVLSATDISGYDYIVIGLGINDGRCSVEQIGSVTDEPGAETVMGQFHKCIRYIRNVNPNAQIIMISPWISLKPGRNDTTSVLAEGARQYNIPFIAQDDNPLVMQGLSTDTIPDRTHPTQSGYYVIGEWLGQKLQSLIGLDPYALPLSGITLKYSAMPYTGKPRTQSNKIQVTSNEGFKTTLERGTDYDLVYSDNINAGTATVSAVGKGHYTGTVTRQYRIKPASLEQCSDVSLKYSELTYSGKKRTQTGTAVVTATPGKKTLTLVRGTDYTVSYKNNLNAGTAEIIIHGQGNYTGQISESFSIVPRKIKSSTLISLQESRFEYTGNPHRPAVKVISTANDEEQMLTEGIDYIVRYSDNTNIGTGTVTVIGTGNYRDSTSLTFKIVPPKTSLLSFKGSRKKYSFTWKPVSKGITGYQIQYSTDSSFKTYRASKTVNESSASSLTVTRPVSDSTYFARIRTYTTVNGKKVYSSWSKVLAEGKGSINVVSDFNAGPDDTRDDYDAFLKAMQTALIKDNDHTVIYIPAGTYYISRTLPIYSNTTVIADQNAKIISTAPNTILRGTHLNSEGNHCAGESCTHGQYSQCKNITVDGGVWIGYADEQGKAFQNFNLVSIKHSKNITLTNMVCQRAPSHYFNLSGDRNITVSNVIFENAISFDEKTNYTHAEAIHLDFCNEAGEGNAYAMPWDETPVRDVLVENCTFDNVYAGLGNHHTNAASRSSDITIRDCTFKNLSSYAVFVPGMDSVSLYNNVFDKVGIMAIINDSTDVVVKNNQYTGARSVILEKSGIYIKNSSDLQIVNNEITDPFKAGIEIRDSHHVSVIGNTIINPGTKAISMDSKCTDVTLKTNKSSGFS